MAKAATDRLYGMVGEVFGPDGISAKGVAAMLDRHAAAGAKELDLYLSSDGGDVGEGLAIYSQIQRFPGAVTIRVDGRALSIASVIALAGKRLVMPQASMFMVHNPWRVTVGGEPEHDRAKGMLATMRQTVNGVYVAASGLSPARAQAMMDKETWLTAQQAKDLGFVDEVLPSSGAQASGAPRSLLVNLYQNTPERLRWMSADAALLNLEVLLMRQRIEETARSASAAAAGPRPR